MRMEGGLFFIDVEEGSGRQTAWTGADVFYECKHSSRLLGTRTPPLIDGPFATVRQIFTHYLGYERAVNLMCSFNAVNYLTNIQMTT